MPPATPPRALRLARLTLRVADVGAAAAFYREALGFASSEEGAAREGTVLSLGRRELALVRADPSAAPYPRPGAANDPWFQHFAIRVSNMAEAFSRVRRSGAAPISIGGPQVLPPNTGSVTAYKFRDPEGHPLELSYDPHTAPSPPDPGAGPFIAIDHTAVAVRDLDAALDFYIGVLGLTPSGRSLNVGPEQDRLDGLKDARVDIVALAAAGAGPHLELLHYRNPASAPPRDVDAGDIAATLATYHVEDLRAVTGALEARRQHWTPVSDGVVARDPDGHWVRVNEG